MSKVGANVQKEAVRATSLDCIHGVGPPDCEVLSPSRGAEGKIEVSSGHAEYSLPIRVNGPHNVAQPTVTQVLKELTSSMTDEHKAYLKQCSVLVGTPCYGNSVNVTYLQSMLHCAAVMKELGVVFEPMFIGTESLITRGRNGIVAEFLGSDHTHLLFIDADIGFKPAAVLRLLLAKKQVVSAIYPLKRYNWERIPDILNNLPPGVKLTPRQLEELSCSYVFNMRESRIARESNFIVPIMDAPTGFMMLSRQLMQYLATRYPERKYVNDVPSYDTTRSKGNFYNFFDTMVDPDSKRYLSEDYAFSRLCQKSGIKVYGDIFSPLTHTGVNTWHGNLYKQLLFMNQKVPTQQRPTATGRNETQSDETPHVVRTANTAPVVERFVPSTE